MARVIDWHYLPMTSQQNRPVAPAILDTAAT